MIYPDYERQIQDLTYPDRKAIKAMLFEGFEDFVGTKKEIEAREEALKAQADLEIKEALKQHAQLHNSVLSAFAAALAEEYGTGNPVVDDKVYSLAWEDGHSSGVSEVENHYLDYAELAQIAFDEGKKSV